MQGITTALQNTERALTETQKKFRQTALSLLVRRITKRFGELPEWVQSKLDAATPAQIELWADKALEAQTLGEYMVL